jgi:hypothetical protein
VGRISLVTITALVLLAIGWSTQGVARERISCTRHGGCHWGKDSKTPIAGMNCESRQYHGRHYYFCTPDKA